MALDQPVGPGSVYQVDIGALKKCAVSNIED